MVNRTGRRGWLAWGGAVGLGVLAAAAVCVSGMGGCAEERAEVPHAVAVANGIRPDPVTGAETAPVSRVPKMLEVYTQAVADGTKEQLDTAAAKADAKRLDAEQKAAAHAVRIDRNARTTAQKIRGLQDDLENDNAAEAALSAAEQRQFARDITDALAAGTTAAAAARAEGERNAKLTTAAYQDALARQAQKDQWLSIGGSVLTAGGNLVGASVGVPGLGTLLGGAVVAGFGGIAYQQRQKKKAAEQTAEQNAADAAEKEAIVLSVVKAVAALGKDHPAMAAELKGYLRDHVTGAADDVIETLKRENGVIDLVKAPQIKLAA